MRKTVFVVTSVMLLSLYCPLARAEDGQIPQPIAIVSAFLQLSEDQTHALITTVQTRDAAIRPIAESLQAIQQQLGQELEAANPDTSAAGALLVQLHAGQKNIHEIAQQAFASFAETLTDDQRHRLELIRQAAQVTPVLPAFAAVGLVRAPNMQ